MGILTLALGVGVGGAWAAAARWWPLALSRDPSRALPGLRIDGVPVAGGQSVAGLVQQRAEALEGRRVRLVMNEGGAPRPVVEATLGELGVHVDVAGVTSRALRIGRTGDALSRAALADRARRGEVDVALEPRFDARAVVMRLAPLKEDLDVGGTPARLDLDHHTVVPEIDGRSLDVDATADLVARAALDPDATEIELPFADVAPHVTRASLAHVDVTHVMASFKTYFSRHGDQGPRALNIEVAASHIDGLVIEPGQLVSFNEVVGERSEDNGFKKAFEIFKGEYTEGVGGGTCQVASTFHAIAFFGGLEIVQRLPHSRPSVYIPAGLDATVVYPTVDLKVRNPFPFPVVVHATVGANVITMELLGADKPVDVMFDKTVLSTTPYDRKVEEDPKVSQPKRKQKGIDGMELLRSRVIAWHNGPRKVERSHEIYPPTKEVWQVPPGFDESTLPPLGEDLPKPQG
jgi:vancomycin resistance protein YoaR